MKNFLILIVIISTSIYAQGSWETLNSPVITNLTKCIFIDSVNGWATGDNGKILLTTNGGQSWNQKNLPVEDNIIYSDFINMKMGWAAATFFGSGFLGTHIYSTKDGGDNWTLLPFPYSNKNFSSVRLMDSLKGFVGGYNGSIFVTTDGGANWDSCQVDSFKKFFYVNEFTFYDKNFGFAYGGLMDLGGIIWKTTNGGSSWTGKNISSEPIRKIHFFDSLHVIAIGGDAEYGVSKYVSSDGGENWSGENLSFLAIPYTLAFRTPSEAWVPLGFVTSFLSSVDSGITWKENVLPENYAIYDMQFPDSLHGYAVGLDGIILRYVNNPTGINDFKDYTFKVYQNYPNPFNPETVISFSLMHQEKVHVIIYDLLGKEIKDLAENVFSEGYHEIKFNAQNLSSGVYFYKVTGESFSAIRKMILIR